MRRRRLRIIILLTLLVSTLSVAVSVGATLYRPVFKSNAEHLQHMADTTARLIQAVAAFDRVFSENTHEKGAAAATLGQVRSALGAEGRFGATGEVLLIAREGENIRVLIHQVVGDLRHDHPDIIPPGSNYYEALSEALDGVVGVSEVIGLYGHEFVLGRRIVEGTGWAVVVERRTSEIQEPFFEAASVAAAITFIFVLAGGFINYRAAFAVSDMAKIAEQNALNALQDSERAQKRLEDALEVINEGFALFDADDRLVMYNQVYHDLYSTHGFAIEAGKTLEETLRAGIQFGAFPQAEGREEEWILERIAQHKATETIEQQLADGRWLNISERRTSDGGIVGVRTDITELKQREFALKDSEQRYKDFTTTASDWVWETDKEHRFVEVSPGTRDSSTFQKSLVEGRRRDECAAEETDNEKWANHLSDINAHRSFKGFQYWMIAPNNTRRLISVSGLPAFDSEGQFKGYRGTARDITEEYQAYKQLEAAEERLRLAFENVTIGIIVADRKGQILSFNPAAQKMFGYNPNEIIGKNVSTLAAGDDRRDHDLYIEHYLETGEAEIIGIGREVTGQRKDGTTFPVNLGVGELIIDDEIQFIASLLDLSAEKLLEEKLRQSQKMEAVGQLVGGIAHDFNNLLGIIIGNLDLIRHKIEPDSRFEKQVNKAFTAAERGANLTRRLLNFSRQMPDESSVFDVNTTLADLHDLIQKALTKNVSVCLELADGLPLATAEKDEFEDAITNLCINARDAMPEGGKIIIETLITNVSPREHSEFKDLKPGRYIEIDISDTGTGMPHDVATRIFEPFFSTKEKGKGTGLGLSMVYGFAKRSKGLITVYSEVGLGTTFKLFLPVNADGVETSTVNDMDEGQTIDYSGSEKVLIVDDEFDLAEVAQTILSDLGYETLVAHNGHDALEIIKKDRSIDLVLSDVIMPGGMNGYELAEKATQANPKLKICLASGYTGMAMKNNGREHAAYPLLKKPYSNDVLAAQVRSIFDGN